MDGRTGPVGVVPACGEEAYIDPREQPMKPLLKLEELAQFLACALALYLMDVAWWVYLLLLIGPDIGMLGYLVNTQVGAVTYNILHHKALAVLVTLLGLFSMGDDLWLMLAGLSNMGEAPLMIIGLILYGHAAMDRMLGFGLKYGDSFQHTHLGWIGKHSE